MDGIINGTVFEFTETIAVKAPHESVWRYVVDAERWWPPSNPEHIRLRIHMDDSSIGPDTEIRFEERVAEVRGRASGRITDCEDGRVAAWKARATYRYVGIPIRVREEPSDPA